MKDVSLTRKIKDFISNKGGEASVDDLIDSGLVKTTEQAQFIRTKYKEFLKKAPQAVQEEVREIAERLKKKSQKKPK